jgi:hypothetical protein
MPTKERKMDIPKWNAHKEDKRWWVQVMCEDHNSTREEWITMQRTHGHMKNKDYAKKMVACRVNCYTKNKLLCKQHTIAWKSNYYSKKRLLCKEHRLCEECEEMILRSYRIHVKRLLSLAPQTSMSWNRLTLAHCVGHVAEPNPNMLA